MGNVALMSWWQGLALWQRVFCGLLAGTSIGVLLHYMPTSWGGAHIAQNYLYPVGQAFVRLIKMLVVPLVVTTLVSGVVSMGDPERLGRIGLKVLALYIGTTFFAVWLGIASGLVFQPGEGMEEVLSLVEPEDAVSPKAQSVQSMPSPTEQMLAIIPVNPVQALAEANLLSIIFFSIFLGIGILLAGQKAKPIADFFDSASDVIMQLTTIVMTLAPFGVMALMAWVVGTKGFGVITSAGKLLLALYAACILQILLVYGGLIVRVFLRMPLIGFFKGVASAVSVAFSTASSSAALPVSITCAEKNLGIDKSVAGSVLPIGATINMDGTAIYLGIVALFAAQILGLELSFSEYAMIAFTATLMSIGAAGIPSAGLLMAAGVLSVVGLDAAEATLVIAFIFPFDRVLDMMRTATNVTGDLAVASAVAKWELGSVSTNLHKPTVKTPRE